MGFYIIEINDKYKQVVLLSADGELYCKDVTGLMPYTEPDLDAIRKEEYNKGFQAGSANTSVVLTEGTAKKIRQEGYNKGFSDAKKEAYQRGLNDAREGKASCQFCEYEMCSDRVDPCRICACNYINFFEPKKQEEEEQIQVGDEVITASGKAVVTGVGPVHFEYVYADGSHGYDKVKNVKKTGRHFPEIAEVLAKMKESDNG